MKRRLAIALLGTTALMLCFSGCGKKNEATKAAAESEETEKEGNGEEEAPEDSEKEQGTSETEDPVIEDRIVILFPGSMDDQRWAEDADILKTGFLEAGYTSEVLYAEGDADLQVKQLEESAVESTIAVIIAPEDPYNLTEALNTVKDAGIPIFDYDELIMDTDRLNYYITFDYRAAGHLIADTIIKDFELDKEKEETADSLSMLSLMGRADRLSDRFVVNGMLEGLMPFYETGALTPSDGSTAANQADIVVSALDNDSANQKSTLEAALEEGAADIICVTGEEMTQTVSESTDQGSPYVISVDSHLPTIQAAADGKIRAALFMDNRSLAEKCVETVTTCLKGEDPEVSNYQDYDNGVRLIKAITTEAEIIDKDNYQILVDNGYFEENEIQPTTNETGRLQDRRADRT